MSFLPFISASHDLSQAYQGQHVAWLVALSLTMAILAACPEHVRDWAIVEAIIGITKKLGMDVIAEGVETHEQQERLEASGCLRYQGYLFSKPLPIEELPLPQG